MLLAAEAGDGWVPLGPTAAKAGRKVATVFEDPSIEASDIEIYRTHTHELMIRGTGFNKAARPTLDFEPALDSFDVYVNVSCGVVMHLLICLFYCFGGGGDGVAFVNTVSGVVMGLIRHFCGGDAWEAYLRRETRGLRVSHAMSQSSNVPKGIKLLSSTSNYATSTSGYITTCPVGKPGKGMPAVHSRSLT